eukprot:360633-Chlamydomonas_euryale.AAC.24
MRRRTQSSRRCSAGAPAPRRRRLPSRQLRGQRSGQAATLLGRRPRPVLVPTPALCPMQPPLPHSASAAPPALCGWSLPLAFMRKKTAMAPTNDPHLRIDCAKPKHAERLPGGARSEMRASRGAACTPFASRSTAFAANSGPAAAAPAMPNLAAAPIAKPSVMADLRLAMRSDTTPEPTRTRYDSASRPPSKRPMLRMLMRSSDTK